MLKKSLVLALIFLPGLVAALWAASAIASVTLYGVADIGLAYQSRQAGLDSTVFSNPGINVSQVGVASGQQSGSRWGIKGVEDLGSGVQANFVFESSVDLTDGSSSGFTRQSTVGLSSASVGSLDLGRRLSPGSYAFGGIDPFDYSFDQAALGTSMGAAFVRLSNMVAYSTPTLFGVTGYVGWSFDTGLRGINSPESPRAFGTTNKFRALSTGLRYADDRLVVAGLLDIFYSPSGEGSYAVKQWNVGATYDFKIVKLHGAFGQNIDGRINGTRVFANVDTSGGVTNTSGAVLFLQGARTTQWMVGMSAPITPRAKVFASFQQLLPGGDFKVGVTATQTTSSIGYTYAVSNRTNFYAYYSYMNAPDMYASGNSQVLGLGVRHLF